MQTIKFAYVWSHGKFGADLKIEIIGSFFVAMFCERDIFGKVFAEVIVARILKSGIDLCFVDAFAFGTAWLFN